MMLVCINSEDGKLSLTIGKIYSVKIPTFDKKRALRNHYGVTDDRGVVAFYYKRNFITIEEYRERKLNQIGI